MPQQGCILLIEHAQFNVAGHIYAEDTFNTVGANGVADGGIVPAGAAAQQHIGPCVILGQRIVEKQRIIDVAGGHQRVDTGALDAHHRGGDVCTGGIISLVISNRYAKLLSSLHCALRDRLTVAGVLVDHSDFQL